VDGISHEGNQTGIFVGQSKILAKEFGRFATGGNF